MSNDEARRNDEIRMSKNKAAQVVNLRFQKTARRGSATSLDHPGFTSSFDIRPPRRSSAEAGGSSLQRTHPDSHPPSPGFGEARRDADTNN
jgi:hypothetical protein